MTGNSGDELTNPALLPRFLQTEFQARRLNGLLLVLVNPCGLLLMATLMVNLSAASPVDAAQQK
ncbi:hypothetical protein SJI19_01275 [Acerihabitans sp. TG2]|uniref:hypothetical protein n=1 Tax=Acerihabitans sp. TG2 TaxID=3096008 RepID=UPI002B23D3C8|nr:hypothetical protein [Acerihabitans sp. TG2]MEA9389193.1 hypothetical protein [Acerihabitans sp. TG2]